MAEVIMPLIDTDEVLDILLDYFEGDDDYDAIMDLLMGRVGDGTIKEFIRHTFCTRDFWNYWQCVRDAVTDWADDVLDRADNTDRE